MKKVVIVLLVLIGAYLCKIPEYKELNDLAIIDGIGVYYDGDNYNVYLREIIPIKSDQGIDYEYKYYDDKDDDIKKAYKKIVTNTKKKFYLKRCRTLITNLYTSDSIMKDLDIKPKSIVHKKDNIDDSLKVK